MKENNFTVKDVVTENLPAIKKQYGVSTDLSSCHTAIVNGYVVEGHVPASDIKKLLETGPDIIGIAVPGMPAGTPGMEMGGKKVPYDVLSFDRNGNKKVFASHR